MREKDFKTKLDNWVIKENAYCGSCLLRTGTIHDKQFFKGQQFIYSRVRSLLPFKAKKGVVSWIKRRKVEVLDVLKNTCYSTDPYSYGYHEGKDSALDKLSEVVER